MLEQKKSLTLARLFYIQIVLIDQDNYFIVVHFYGSRLNRKGVCLVVNLDEFALRFFGKLKRIRGNFDNAFFQDRNNRRMMVQYLETSVYSRKRYRGDFSFK